jgi:Rrf2 family protein
MLRLSKKTEYALIAVQYIASSKGRVVSAKEIAEYHSISFEFLSKALQILVRKKFIASHQGINGGYSFAKDPHVISVAEIIEAIEGKPSIVDCCGADGNASCDMHHRCPIKTPMAILQRRIDEVLYSMTVAQMAGDSHVVIVHTPYQERERACAPMQTYNNGHHGHPAHYAATSNGHTAA